MSDKKSVISYFDTEKKFQMKLCSKSKSSSVQMDLL